jgi:alkanesulfonate monooxygenase SsuD/methylene tetrahydromethanopterin reductase-like flavin-dependent oxidoreductase (luciferase family)
MTALTLSQLCEGRFLLGLGASGPQVVEGLHDVSFAKPMQRMRENVEIIRQALRGEQLALAGEHCQLPRLGGEGKSTRLAFRPDDIPIYLATIAPRGLELTGELVDGWLSTSFMPEASEAHLGHLRRGAERAGRELSDLDLCAGGVVGIGDDLLGVYPGYDGLRQDNSISKPTAARGSRRRATRSWSCG